MAETIEWEEIQNRLVDSDYREFLDGAKGKPLAVDTESNGRDVRDGRGYCVGISIAYRDSFGQVISKYFPFRHRGSGNFGPSVLEELRHLLQSAPGLVFHNAKYDIVSLSTLGIQVPSGRWFCTMIMAHLINENFPFSKSLDECVKAYVGEGYGKEMSQSMKDTINAFGWEFISADEMMHYAETDAVITYLLFLKLKPLFDKEELQDYWTHKARLIEVVITMESRGVGVNVEFCKQQAAMAQAKMDEYAAALGINPASSKDMTELMINQLGLPVVKTSSTTGKPSFDREAMGIYDEILAKRYPDNPIAERILGYRGWQKAQSAFYSAYLSHMSPDGRLRPSYRHHKDSEEGGTVTGRLSCAKPNLQQIPRVSDKPWNGNVKQSFTASPGYSLYEADYSQLELRLGTAYANEPYLKAVFREGRDIFTEMAAQLGWIRQNTKGFVYSVQYGAGRKRISDVFGVSQDAAGGLIEAYYARFPGFRRVSEIASSRCLRDRKVKLWSGRFRHFRSARDDSHKAFNSVIQGGAADVVERVMVAVYDEVDQISNGEVRMLLQVHDSIIFEIKDGTVHKWQPEIERVMSNVNEICENFDVVFAVDFHKFGA